MKNTVTAFMVSLIITSMFALALSIQPVEADGLVLSKWAETTPLIDGRLRAASWGIPAEWGDADRIDFELFWGVESHNASLYVKNDYINLYLAFVIEGEDFDVNDRVVFNFDDDHDGVKEIGDDQLWIEMDISFVPWEHQAGRFKDGFFPTPSDAPSWFDDVTSGGDQDGVGAARFTGASPSEPGNYVVEAVHPLNTDDDAHDFSLGVGGIGVGDVVGVNVLYLDAGVVGDGWPTLTWGDWSQMATIAIAGPSIVPLRHLRRNLEIYGIEITQAVQYFNDIGHVDNSLPLAYGKSTVVRVYIDLGFLVESANVTVYLYATNSMGISLAQAGVWGSNGPLAEDAQVPGFLPPSFDFHRENETYTANFILPSYWVTRGSLNLVAFVKAAADVSELSYADNWMSWQTFSFTPTTPPRIGYYLIDYRPTAPGPGPNIPSPLKEARAYEFFEKATPMPDLSDPIQYVYLGTIEWEGPSFTYPNGTFHEQNQEELLTELARKWQALAREGDFYDLIGGLYGGVVNITIGQANGHMGNWPPVFVAYENRPWSFAHEIGHSWPTLLPHSWADHDNPYFGEDRANSSQTYGYDPQRNWFPGEPRNTVKAPLVVSGGDYGALMSYEDRWISPYEWLEFMSAYDPPIEGLGISTLGAVQGSSPGIQVSGAIYGNNTGNLWPIFQTSSILNTTLPIGPYVVELKGPPPAEPLLYSQSFNVSFDSDACVEGLPPLDRAVFMLDLPYNTEAYSVSLWNATISPPVLLDVITASPNPPSVTITYPNGGETLGDSFNVTWTVFDPDTGGDPATFRLFYSNDDGATWKPLSPNIVGTNYTVDASRLPGGSQSLLRILASDGFHTGIGQSSGVFNVPNKSPRVYGQQAPIGTIPIVQNDSTSTRHHAHFGDFIILKGYAFDAEDGVLQNSALSWTSDLEGPLGTGRVLSVTDLRPGIHNITLTATDSHGNNATDVLTVVVELHDVAVVDVVPEKTVLGEGYGLNINVTVENQGNSPETFGVTLELSKLNTTVATVDLFGSASSGWGFNPSNLSSPGPTITVSQGDSVSLDLTSADSFTHNFFVDYDGNTLPSLDEPKSPDFTATVNYEFVAEISGTFTYYCQYHSSIMFGAFRVQAPTRTVVAEETVNYTVLNGTSETKTFSITGLPKGEYVITVHASYVQGEADMADNLFVGDWVLVTIAGDVDGDRDVDIFDIVKMASVYGVELPDSRYDPYCDIDGDGDIDIFDIVIAAGHYGDSW